MAKQPTQARVRRRERKNITNGIAHVNSTFNNTMITISDVQGNTIAWSSAGTMGFKGSRKSTPFAAQMAAEDAGKKAAEHGALFVVASYDQTDGIMRLDEPWRTELFEICRLDGLELALVPVAASARLMSWTVDHGLQPDFANLGVWIETVLGGWI